MAQSTDPDVLFHGEFNGINYILRSDGVHVVRGDANKRDISAIEGRITRIYADVNDPEYENFNTGVNYMDLARILKL